MPLPPFLPQLQAVCKAATTATCATATVSLPACFAGSAQTSKDVCPPYVSNLETGSGNQQGKCLQREKRAWESASGRGAFQDEKALDCSLRTNLLAPCLRPIPLAVGVPLPAKSLQAWHEGGGKDGSLHNGSEPHPEARAVLFFLSKSGRCIPGGWRRRDEEVVPPGATTSVTPPKSRPLEQVNNPGQIICT